MAEGLTRKKRIRGGHRASTTRVLTQASEAMERSVGPTFNLTELMKYKLTLTEKLSTLTRLDEEILDLIEEEEVVNEIEQADVFKERIHACMIDIDSTLGARHPTEPAAVVEEPRTPTEEPRIPTGDATEPRTPIEDATEPRIPTGTIPITVADIPIIPLGHGHASRVRLPKLTMRQFNGDLTNVLGFLRVIDTQQQRAFRSRQVQLPPLAVRGARIRCHIRFEAYSC